MIEEDRLVNAENNEYEDQEIKQQSLRPKLLQDYIGQDKIREQISIFIEAAKTRQESLDHILIFGPPGLGKTTLAYIIAEEMHVGFRQTSGPVLDKAADLAAILTNLESGDVLFIDEIHRLNPIIEEILYPAMEDNQLYIMIGEGPSARSIKLDLPPFTLIGATTKAGSLTSPLRDRFGIVQRLDFYDTKELKKIIFRSAQIFKIDIDEQGAMEIAKRSRGTPRIANRLLRRVRDYAQVKSKTSINQYIANYALNELGIDKAGFNSMDRTLLKAIRDKFSGGPVGIDNLATAISEERETIEDVLEPYLIQQGFLMRSPRGRIITDKAIEYFNSTTI